MAADDGLSANENDDDAVCRAGACVAAPAVAVMLSAAATTPAAATVTALEAVGARMLRMVDRVLLIAGPPVTATAPPPPSGRPGGRRASGQLGRGTHRNAAMVQFGDGDLSTVRPGAGRRGAGDGTGLTRAACPRNRSGN